MNLHQLFLTKNACYISGQKHTVKGIMVHSTGANNPFVKRYVNPDDGLLGLNTYGNHWNSYHGGGKDIGAHQYIDSDKDGKCDKCGGREVCVHAFIGKQANGDIATYQTLPWDIKGWHSGSGSLGYEKNANNTGYIGFEICEDNLESASYFYKVYTEAVELCIYLCKQYGLTESDIICHAEGWKKGIASNHGDVIYWFSKFGKSMDIFRADVKNGLTAKTVEKHTENTSFNVGDLVKVKDGATWYNGECVPAWVIKDNWFISSIKGDRVVIDKSEDGKNAVCSPINASYLVLIKAATTTTPIPTTTTLFYPTTATATIDAGDVVKITGTKYYSGAKIPDWVRAKNWIVKEVSGARVVIDKSQDGKNAICSPVNAADLAVVTASAAKPAAPVVNTTIETGDTVKIVGTKYYSGAKIPDWVKDKNWIVLEAKGDRVVVDKSADGKNAICSPIKRIDLQLVKKK